MEGVKAVIFDMDGVIVDSEPLWMKAEKKVFASVGVSVSEELGKITEALTPAEVTRFWYERQPWTNKTLEEVENEVIDQVEFLINNEGYAMDGIKEILERFKSRGCKIGLATNSPFRLISTVLNKFGLSGYFDVVSSAEHELRGKPDPAIYLSSARKLNVKPESCLVFEDSYTGLIAAKNAGMKVVAFLPGNVCCGSKFDIADMKIGSFSQFDFSLLD